MFGDYQRQANSIAQSQLESDEGLLYSRASGIRQDAYERANLLNTSYSDELAKTQDEFMEQLGLEQGVPGALKLLEKGVSSIGSVVKKGGELYDRATQASQELAQKLAPQPKEPNMGEPQNEFEMKDIEDDDVPSSKGTTITQEDIPEGGGSGEDVSRLGQQEPTLDPAEFTKEEKPIEETDVDTGLEVEGKEAGEDVGEELGEEGISELAEAGGSAIGEAIGSAIPVIGWIGDLAGLISGAVDISKVGSLQDPEQKMSQEIKSANTQTEALQAKVSSDQFEQRIGASMPSFGSLAVRGQTAQQQIALHD